MRTVLTPGASGKRFWRDIWRYRDLLYMLSWRDVSVRYKQTVVGAAWAVIRPLLTMIIFTVVFGRVANLPSEGDAPYAIMVFAGMLPWFLFAGILADGALSLVTNSALVGKVYFPRVIIPFSSASVHTLDFVIGVAILLGMCAWFGYWPSYRVIFLPIIFILALLAALGPALIMAALNIKYRDFRYIIPFIVQFGLYVSPVGFSSSVVPDEFRFLYGLNPMVGVIDGFRWCIIGQGAELYMPSFLLSVTVTLFLFFVGIRVFRRSERAFADLI